jgi:hypothetical protein
MSELPRPDPRWIYGALLDPEARAEDAVRLEVPASATPALVGSAVVDMLLRDPDRAAVALVVGGDLVGVATWRRARRWADGFSSTSGARGDGAEASLPGRSMRYVVLRYRCSDCAAETRVLFVDEEAPPRCPSGHGPMERDEVRQP